MDSDSSVDRVELDGKCYRLKCDCCKSRRSENEYDFHPCKVEKCTFSICWACLQRWKDQSDKDITKRFLCPLCHTEYDTKLIEEHKPLSVDMIAKVNAKSKVVRKKKKQRRKNAEKTKKQTEKLKYLEQRRLANNKKKRKEAAKNLSKSKKLSNNVSRKTHVLNKNRVMVSFNKNMLLKQQWNDKMTRDIFARIGPLANITKTDSDLIVDFKKCQSDKARRVLLYLFDLNVNIMHIAIKRNANVNDNDCFNLNMSGGKREFLKQRDQKLNWNEYSIPSYDVVPPGCKRWISQNVKRLTKDMFIREMQRRVKLRQNKSAHLYRPPKPERNPPVPTPNNISASYPTHSLSDIRMRPPPISATSSLGSMHTNTQPLHHKNYHQNYHQMNPIRRSNSSEHLHGNLNNNNNWHLNNNNVSHLHHNNVYKSPLSAITGHKSPYKVYEHGYGAPKIQRSSSNSEMIRDRNVTMYQYDRHNSYKSDDTLYKTNNYNYQQRQEQIENNVHEPGSVMVNGKQKMLAKISNLLAMKRKKQEVVPAVNGLKWQRKSPVKNEPEEKKDEFDISGLIRWRCNNQIKRITIVSDDDELSDSNDETSTTTTKSNKSTLPITPDPLSKQHSIQSTISINTINTNELNDNDNEYDYDYSDSDDDVVINHYSFPTRAPIIRPPKKVIEKAQRQHKIAQIQARQQRRPSPPPSPQKLLFEEENEGETGIEIKDMTIQQMLDNLENFEGDQVDAILAKLLPKNNTDHSNNNNYKPQRLRMNNLTVNNENEYDYDDSDEDSNYVSHPNPEQFPSYPQNKDDHNADLDFIAKSMAETNNDSHSPQLSPLNHSKSIKTYQQYKNEQEKYEDNGHSHEQMEKVRNEMEQIAKYYSDISLSKLPDIYMDLFNTNIKNVYNGKIKELVLYFSDIFKVKHNSNTNHTFVVSLIYDHKKESNRAVNGDDDNDSNANGISLQKKLIKSVQTNKNNAALRWAPKRKEEPLSVAAEEEKGNNDGDEDGNGNVNEFKYGPSTMHTVHRGVIGQSAVGQYNKYTSSARPYASQRRNLMYGGKKVKTYGDYEDELPHTPSQSDEEEM